MYIGHIAGVGETALAGVGVCGPVVTMVGSAAVWISWGASPLMGIRMGEGRPEEARRILRTGFCMLLAFSLAMMALVIPLREPMLRFFGASDATYPYADAYFTVYLTGTVFALLAAGLNQMIIAQGFAAQLRRRAGGRPACDLRGDRPELHAGDDDAAGRHFRRHAVHPLV